MIVEQRLAETLGISRTPLREALQRLEGEGLVIKGTGRSFWCVTWTSRNISRASRSARFSNPEAAALAAGRIPLGELAGVRAEINACVPAVPYHTDAHWRSDDNLHELYARNCGNQVLAGMIRTLRVTTRLFEISSLADRLEADSAEHLQIVEALEQDDAKAARRTVAHHLRSLGKHTIDTVR